MLAARHSRSVPAHPGISRREPYTGLAASLDSFLPTSEVEVLALETAAYFQDQFKTLRAGF
jgi:hypothetical protein